MSRSYRPGLVLPLFVALGGCSSDRVLDAPSQANDLTGSDERVPLAIRVDVLPSAVRDTSDELRALPMSVSAKLTGDSDLRLDTIELGRPQRQLGSVTAWRVNPTIAGLPGTEVGVSGTVFVTRPGTLQTYAARADSDGAFEAWVLPSTEYHLDVVPDDPLLPSHSGLLDVGSRPSAARLDLGTGVPIYGRITSDFGPVGGALVHVESPQGYRSVSAAADDLGIYQLRVSPGTWTVVSEGRDLGRDPILRRAEVVVDDEGALVDFTYPTGLDQVLVDGRILGPEGAAAEGSVVRFVSRELLGYEQLPSAAWSTEVSVSGSGTFLVRVVPGTYRVEVVPAATDEGSDTSPVELEVVLTDADNHLGDVSLGELVQVSGSVTDATGAGVTGAQVTCTERGFDRHTFTAFSNDDGSVAIELPSVEVTCEVTPPGDRQELASGRFRFVPEHGERRTWDLVAGRTVTGRIAADGRGEALAVVEIRGPDGALLGFDVTDEEGGFSIPVDSRDY